MAVGAQSATDLLAQIQALLQQYLQLGGDTPVAPEAQALNDAISSTMGDASSDPGDNNAPGAQDAGGLPNDPAAALQQAMAGAGGQDAGNDPMASMKPDHAPTSFKDASSMAMSDMKKKKARPY